MYSTEVSTRRLLRDTTQWVGLVFFPTKKFAVDFRAGAGLNGQANRFLIGTGFAFRH